MYQCINISVTLWFCRRFSAIGNMSIEIGCQRVYRFKWYRACECVWENIFRFICVLFFLWFEYTTWRLSQCYHLDYPLVYLRWEFIFFISILVPFLWIQQPSTSITWNLSVKLTLEKVIPNDLFRSKFHLTQSVSVSNKATEKMYWSINDASSVLIIIAALSLIHDSFKKRTLIYFNPNPNALLC